MWRWDNILKLDTNHFIAIIDSNFTQVCVADSHSPLLMPTIHQVALDSDLQFLRSSITVGTSNRQWCWYSQHINVNKSCLWVSKPLSLWTVHKSFASNLIGKDGSKPCHCYLCESWDVCKSRERASKVWPHSQSYGWLDQLLHLHVPRTSEAAQASSIVWATQGKTWSLNMVAMTVQTYNNLASIGNDETQKTLWCRYGHANLWLGLDLLK